MKSNTFRQFLPLMLIVFSVFYQPAYALSDQVKIDIATARLVDALENSNDAKVISAARELRSLNVDDARLDFFEGRALNNQGEVGSARVLLEKYATEAGSEGQYYRESISLLASMDEAAPEAAQSGVVAGPGATPELSCPPAPAALVSQDVLETAAPVNPQSLPGVYRASKHCRYGRYAESSLTGIYHHGNSEVSCGNPIIDPYAMFRGGASAIPDMPAEMSEQMGLLSGSGAMSELMPPVIVVQAPKVENFGVGFADSDRGEVVVAIVVPGSGASKTALELNDVLVAVNGSTAAAANTQATIAALGTMKKVVLQLRRPSEQGRVFEVTIKKRKYQGPQTLIMQSPTHLSGVQLEVPYKSLNPEDYANWTAAGQRLLDAMEVAAIDCSAP